MAERTHPVTVDDGPILGEMQRIIAEVLQDDEADLDRKTDIIADRRTR